MKGFLLIALLIVIVSSCSGPAPIKNIEVDKNILATQIVATITAEALIAQPTTLPLPTETIIQPTATQAPDPIVLDGAGDSVVDFENPFTISIVHIIGNSNGSHFSVVNYDANGEYLDLLVNTSDPYEGFGPIDFYDNSHTTRFEVNATGEWKIEVLPVSTVRALSIPGIIEGLGDEVVQLVGAKPDKAYILGNQTGSNHFSIVSSSTKGDYLDLLVNTSDPYEGTVLIDGESTYLEINSSDKWSIDIKGK